MREIWKRLKERKVKLFFYLFDRIEMKKIEKLTMP